ncbi:MULTISPECIES: DMT family transporter [Bacillus]|uniref:DMT family transporter n=1 Tax=Bacillus TaxID=1386 RepID=UPI001C9A8E61|nr:MULTISPECIES: DMT family transporter [Bacillus]MBY7114681.1 DMT family transporter [Bacillus sp. 17RED48]
MISMEILIGIFFSILWASGAIATKIGLLSSSPLMFATTRLISAGLIMFVFTYFIKSNRWPKGVEWRQLIILGILNTTLYVGCCFLSLKLVSSSLFNLFITVNPFVVALLSSIFLSRKVTKQEWIGMLIAALGLLIAVYPYLKDTHATVSGVIILAVGMLSMGIGSVCFTKYDMKIDRLVINTWQIIFGSVFAVPLSFLLDSNPYINLDVNFAIGLFWQVVMTSIVSMLLWFYLLKKDPIKANNYLFLTPIFGYLLAWLILKEDITWFHLIGAIFVIAGLLFSGTMNIKALLRPKLGSEKHKSI